MKKIFALAIVLGVAFVITLHAGAATIGDALASPVPNAATFVNTSNQWLVNIWQWITDHTHALTTINTNDPVIATLAKIASWFWHFTLDSFKQGWESLVALCKMALMSGSAAYQSVHWPWQ